MIVQYKNFNYITLGEFLNNSHLSKVNISKLLTKKAISIDNRYLTNLDELVDNIYINYSLLEDNEAQIGTEMNLSIIYEDDNFIAIDKDRGILVHPDGNTTDTLLNGVVYYLKSKYDDSFIRPIHRIDYETEGVVVFAKNIIAYTYTSYLMETNKITKIYKALVSGEVINQEIDFKIGKNRHDSKKYCVSKSGKDAKTIIKVIKKYPNQTLIECKLITGRPHQIRVHLSHIGHPLVGDELYGGSGDKLMLLSSEFSFKFFDKVITIRTRKKI